MSAVIDTLRFSDKLRASGFPQAQADALTRALNDELPEQLATGDDITRLEGVMATKEDIARLEGEIRALDDKVERLIASQNAEFNARFDAQSAEFNARFGALNAKFNFIMALLGLLVALQFIPLAT